ncbi:hypothetical protein M9H77_07284 [Catharanthus roseus]|uniref:Uncharacterized protein n=1 Tax=Catharanthus roseus TaxID=4058 RepID=A0ACC0BUR0_CATRO|nr:hypothetical protein M9H77_07284 [Catharanthus roseus]
METLNIQGGRRKLKNPSSSFFRLSICQACQQMAGIKVNCLNSFLAIDNCRVDLPSMLGSVTTLPPQAEPYYRRLGCTLPLMVGSKETPSFNFEATKPSKLPSIDSFICTLDNRKVLDPPKSFPRSSSLCQVKFWSIISNNVIRNSQSKFMQRTFVKHVEGMECQRKIQAHESTNEYNFHQRSEKHI